MTRPPHPVSFALTAATFTGNHGAEAMLLATMDGLRARVSAPLFNVFSYYPVPDQGAVSDPSVRVFSLTPLMLVFRLMPMAAVYALCRFLGMRGLLSFFPDDVRALADSDAQLDLAGVSFVEGREVFLPFNVLSLVPAFMLGVPVVKLSQAMGPFRRPLNRWVAKSVLRRCAALFARGEDTLDHLRSLSLGVPVHGAPDVAFLLEAGVDAESAQGGEVGDAEEVGEICDAEEGRALGVTRREPTRIAAALEDIDAHRPQARNVVGVCPSSLLAAKVGPDYVALMATVVNRLVEAGDRVVLFPHATRGSADAGPRNNDLHVLRQLQGQLPPSVMGGVTLADHDVSARDILHLLAAVDMAVVSRFHAMVGCLSVARPVAVVGWSHKYAEVMKAFGLEAHVFDGRDVDPEDVLHSLAAFRADAQAFRQRIAGKLRETRAQASGQLDLVASLVGQETS